MGWVGGKGRNTEEKHGKGMEEILKRAREEEKFKRGTGRKVARERGGQGGED